jgi:hypothetical protein
MERASITETAARRGIGPAGQRRGRKNAESDDYPRPDAND